MQLHNEHDEHGRQSQPPSDVIKPIHLSDKVDAVLRNLRQTVTKLDHTCFGLKEIGLEEASNMRARQEQGNALAEDESPSTQAAFGTQMVERRQRHDNTAQKVQGDDIGSDLEKKAALLGLIGVKQPVHRAKSRISEPGTAGGESKTAVAPSVGGFRKSSVSCQDASPAARLESKFQPTHMPPLYPESDRIKSASNLSVANGIVVANTRHDHANSQVHANLDPLHDPIPEWLVNTCRTNGCGRVPTSQKKLLSSWQKRRMGTNDRFPDANIPIDVLKALKRFEINTVLSDGSSSDGEASSASEDIAPTDDDDALSDSDDDTALSWSASPTQRSPRRSSPPGLSLPPDSSLQSKNAESRYGSHEASPVQEAQHLMTVEPSRELNIMDPVSSPPQVSDDSDFGMELELNVPRGLDDDDPNHGVASSSSVHQAKEIPLSKGKDASSLSVTNFSAQAQQQPSSGTSKDTSSTSIVFSTYNDNSFDKEVMHVASAAISKSTHFSVLPDGHQDLPTSLDQRLPYSVDKSPVVYAEGIDICMEEPQEEWQKVSSPIRDHAQDEEQDTRYCTMSPQSLNHKTMPLNEKFGLHEGEMRRSPLSSPQPSIIASPVPQLSQRRNGEQNDRSISFGLSVLPEQSPMSVRSAEPSASWMRAKRKMEVPPPTSGRRPPKRRNIKLVKCRSNSPTRDCDAELRREKEEHLRKFTERQRAQSVHSASGAESEQSLVQHRSASKEKHAPTSAQSDAACSVDAHASQSPKHIHEQTKPATIFDTFQHTYPSYPGNERQFLNQCKAIDKLHQEDKMVPKWQWDDFIVRYQTDYKEYTDQCFDNNEHPEPYHRFYKDNVQNTLYTECVIQSRKTLLTAIEELENKAVGPAAVARSSAMEPLPDKIVGVNSRGPSVLAIKPAQHETPSLEESHTSVTGRKTITTGLAKSERGGSSLGVQKRTRQSLPSAFNRQIERIPHAAPTVGSGPRQSLPGRLNRDTYTRTSSSQSAPRIERGQQPESGDASAGASPIGRASSGRQIPTEPTGDPYRDFIFAHSRITSLTGSGRVRPRSSSKSS